eukprot:4319747-Pleurochrysis_carterae.AAC.1
MFRIVAGPELSPVLWQWERAQRVRSEADRPSNGSASENLATCCCRKKGLLAQDLHKGSAETGERAKIRCGARDIAI